MCTILYTSMLSTFSIILCHVPENSLPHHTRKPTVCRSRLKQIFSLKRYHQSYTFLLQTNTYEVQVQR